MATTVKQAFRDFSSRVNITDTQNSLVSSRWNNVLDAIDRKLYLHNTKPSMLIGSYKRQTMLKPLSNNDVDLMLVLHYSKNKNWDNSDGTIYALNKFKEILDESFPQVSKRRDRNCITMSYSEFKLDVVPAFSIKGGYYKIPDSIRKEWISTDPDTFSSEISGINTNMGGSFVPMIKMMKAWSKNNGDLLEGFHIECMLHKRYEGYIEGYTYSSMFNLLFSYWSTYLSAASYDPVKGDRVDTYISYDDRIDLVKMAYLSKEYSDEAVKAEANEDHETAIYYWRLIFGDYFPAYG